MGEHTLSLPGLPVVDILNVICKGTARCSVAAAAVSYVYCVLLYDEHYKKIKNYEATHCIHRWFGSRMVSMLDSGTEGSGFKSQP